MRREYLYLRDIVEAADHIAQFIAGRSRSGFQESELVRSAVVQKLALIGEAAAHVSSDLQPISGRPRFPPFADRSRKPRACRPEFGLAAKGAQRYIQGLAELQVPGARATRWLANRPA